MNSLKRLFSSILPTSWTEDNEEIGQIPTESRKSKKHNNSESLMDNQDEIQNRQIKRCKRSSKVQYIYGHQNQNQEDQEYDKNLSYGGTENQNGTFENEEFNFESNIFNFKCLPRDNQEFTNEEIRSIQRQVQNKHKRQKRENLEAQKQQKEQIQGKIINRNTFQFDQGGEFRQDQSRNGQQIKHKKDRGRMLKQDNFEFDFDPNTGEQGENGDSQIEEDDQDVIRDRKSTQSLSQPDQLIAQDDFSFGGESNANKSQSQEKQMTLEKDIEIEDDQIVKVPEISKEDQFVLRLKENIQRQKKAANNSMKKIESGLNCPICMDYIISCRIAVCGHSFCHQCIVECLVRKKECPHCRKNIRRKVLQPSLPIDNSVKMIVQGKKEDGSQHEVKRWNERMIAYNKWLNSHILNDVKPGDKIDACDTEYIWCKATVELVLKLKNRKPLVYLHYEGWNRKYDEYIYIDSHRIAPLGVYTARSDIPIYRMIGNNNQQNQSMMYAVVLQNAAEEARFADHERRMRNLNQNNQEDEDEEENEEQQDEQGDQQDNSAPNENEEAQQDPGVQNIMSSDGNQPVHAAEASQQIGAPVEPQAVSNIESFQAEINRSLENVNNQLQSRMSRVNNSVNHLQLESLASNLQQQSFSQQLLQPIPQRLQQEPQASSLLAEIQQSEPVRSQPLLAQQPVSSPSNSETNQSQINSSPQAEVENKPTEQSTQMFQQQVEAMKKAKEQNKKSKDLKKDDKDKK